MTRIICFGDSITFGYTDAEGGWTQRLHNALAKIYVTKQYNPIHEVVNLGISGETIEGLLNRAEAELDARIGEDGQVVIIAIGTNDSVYKMKNNKTHTSPEKFEKNLQKLIKICRQRTSRIILLGLLPCEEEKMQPMPWSTTGKAYSNKRLKIFNDTIAGVAKAEELAFVDMFDDMFRREQGMYLHDGLHPNSVGHNYIADKLKKLTAELASNYKEAN